MYVDDVFFGVSNVDDVEYYYCYFWQFLVSVGMNFRQWIINLSKLKEKLVVENIIFIDKLKVLGLEWDLNVDIISFFLMKVMLEIKVLYDQFIKRSVLSIVVKLFDLFGLFELFIVRVKIML